MPRLDFLFFSGIIMFLFFSLNMSLDLWVLSSIRDARKEERPRESGIIDTFLAGWDRDDDNPH